MDGTLGSQTAWMLDGSGVQITSGEELAEIVRARRGGRLAGRRARDRRPREPRGARRVRADARASWQPRGLRQRIEHAQCLAPEDLPRFAELGVAVSAQFTHAPSDESSRSASGPTSSTARTRSARCSTRARSSRTAPTRRSRSSTRGRASSPASLAPLARRTSALTLEQALHATCVAPAWLSHDERIRGTLVPGRLADLVVLDRDPFACEPAELRRGAGRRDDGRRPLGAQPAALVT